MAVRRFTQMKNFTEHFNAEDTGRINYDLSAEKFG
jgi:hypothetical protein